MAQSADEPVKPADAPTTEKKSSTSRRDFLGAALGSAAGTALVAGGANAQRAAAPLDAAIKPQKLFLDSLAAPARRLDFSAGPLTGAQVFANLCKDENLAAMFLAPGNYTITHEIAQVGIPCYGGRSEGSMCSAADGFARISGEVAACSGTEGPGFTHMVMNIAIAHFANTPLLVLASNRTLASEDTQRQQQFMYQQSQTQGIRKYGKRITAPERIYDFGATAFRNIKTGVPGVAHLDFPSEIADARFADATKLVNYFEKANYRSESRAMPSPTDVKRAIAMIAKSERPVLIAGHGVAHREAHEALRLAAEKNELIVVPSGPIRGAFPDDHRLTGVFANEALMSADLVVFVGQYLMPSVGEWTLPPGVPTIRVHPTPEDIGHNWPVDLGIVGDEAYFLEALADGLPRRKRAAWVAEVQKATAKRMGVLDSVYAGGLKASQSTGTLHPGVVTREVHDFLYKGKIDPKQTVTGFGGMTTSFYAGQFMRAFRPRQELIIQYQFGAIGPDVAMMLGAAAAVDRGLGHQKAYQGAPVFVITSDAGANYSLFEVETAMKYKLPMVVVIYNNNAWGTFTNSRGAPRAQHIHLFQENLRYDLIAQALGARGDYVHTPEQLRSSLQAAYDAAAREKVSTVINCQGTRDFAITSMYPPGLGFPPEPGIGAFMH